MAAAMIIEDKGHVLRGEVLDAPDDKIGEGLGTRHIDRSHLCKHFGVKLVRGCIFFYIITAAIGPCSVKLAGIGAPVKLGKDIGFGVRTGELHIINIAELVLLQVAIGSNEVENCPLGFRLIVT